MKLSEIPLFVERAALFHHVPHLCGHRLADDVTDLVAGYSGIRQLLCNGVNTLGLVAGDLAFNDCVHCEMDAGIPDVPLFIDQFFGQRVGLERPTKIGVIANGNLPRLVFGQISVIRHRFKPLRELVSSGFNRLYPGTADSSRIIRSLMAAALN